MAFSLLICSSIVDDKNLIDLEMMENKDEIRFFFLLGKGKRLKLTLWSVIYL